MCARSIQQKHSTHIDSWDSQGKLIASQRLDHLWLQFIVLLHREPHVSIQREFAAMVLQNGFGGLVVCSGQEITARQQAAGCWLQLNKTAAFTHASRAIHTVP